MTPKEKLDELFDDYCGRENAQNKTDLEKLIEVIFEIDERLENMSNHFHSII